MRSRATERAFFGEPAQESEWQAVDLSAHVHVKRWYLDIAKRPAVVRPANPRIQARTITWAFELMLQGSETILSHRAFSIDCKTIRTIYKINYLLPEYRTRST